MTNIAKKIALFLLTANGCCRWDVPDDDVRVIPAPGGSDELVVGRNADGTDGSVMEQMVADRFQRLSIPHNHLDLGPPSVRLSRHQVPPGGTEGQAAHPVGVTSQEALLAAAAASRIVLIDSATAATNGFPLSSPPRCA